jgi:hypothetical protein
MIRECESVLVGARAGIFPLRYAVYEGKRLSTLCEELRTIGRDFPNRALLVRRAGVKEPVCVELLYN